MDKKSSTDKERNNRKTLEGVVVSDKMNKTRTITILRRFSHPLYGKVMTRNTKVFAHDENNETKAGDRVQIMSTRPLSRLKRWRITKTIEKARIGVED